jgi:polyvinyl alcohol dehydrogenase (cytochrome)
MACRRWLTAVELGIEENVEPSTVYRVQDVVKEVFMRTSLSIMFLLCLVPAVAAAQPAAPQGAAVYKQHCASCHEGTIPRMPNREALRQMAPEHVESELASFSMRRQGGALSPAERRAVAEFVTGRPAGSYRAPLSVIPKTAYCSAAGAAGDPLAGASWNGWGIDLQNTRHQSAAAAGLTAAEVPRLRLKWSFGFPGASASGSQVTVMGSRLFVGSRNGVMYALDKDTGCLVWAFEADAGTRSTPVVARSPGAAGSTVYFADAHAQVYALDAASGTLRWKVKVEEHPDATITGAVVLHDGRLYVPVSSNEEGTAVMASYQCCTFRGSVAALDATTGRQVWKTYTIPTEPQPVGRNSRGTQLWAPSGAAVWSAPALDPERNRLYITTGDSYSNPAAPQSDAIMALALDTGRVVWTRQTLAADAWNTACLPGDAGGGVNCPDPAGPDHDFGSSPALVTLANGQRVLLAGQKSGTMFGIDPDTGDVRWRTQAGEGGVLGGIEWGFATDSALAYVSLSSAFEKPSGEAGGLVALNVADGTVRWSAAPAADSCAGRQGCNTAQPAAVSSIPGAVFSGSLDGHFRAYDSTSGKVLLDVNTTDEYDTVNGVPARGGSINGPGATVAGGMVFVNSGYSTIGFMPGNVLLAFSVDGQ